LRHLISQSFDTFNIYGKQPEALSSILSAFTVALEDIQTEDITHAFKVWLKRSSVMPTPSDIREIAVENARHRAEVMGKESARAAPRTEKSIEQIRKEIPWYGMPWTQIEERYMPELERHLIELTQLRGKEAAEGYLLFLKTGPHNKV